MANMPRWIRQVEFTDTVFAVQPSIMSRERLKKAAQPFKTLQNPTEGAMKEDALDHLVEKCVRNRAAFFGKERADAETLRSRARESAATSGGPDARTSALLAELPLGWWENCADMVNIVL